MISIIIPTYNEEKVIDGCLKQFIPYKKKYNLELIVSDGKSGDATVKRAKRLADKVVVWGGAGRQNIPQGRNAGCFKAKGDILFLTDADCRIKDIRGFFDRVSKEFENKKLVGLTGSVLVNPKEKKFSDNIHGFFNFYNQITNLFGIGGARGEFQIVRASAFMKINGYNEKLVSSEDYDLFYRLRKVGKVKFVNSLVIFESARRYRKHGYFKTVFTWLYEGVCVTFTGKSPFKEWESIR